MFDSLCLMFDSLFSPETLVEDMKKKEAAVRNSETPYEEMGLDLVDEAWDECLRKLGCGSCPVIVNMKNEK